jgi:hypothetical protein
MIPGNVPKFADGGIVTSPGLAMVGEKGPEAVVPLAKGIKGADIHANIHKEHVVTQPQTTEVTSPELNDIASQSDRQTELLEETVKLLSRLEEYLKPSSLSLGRSPDEVKASTNITVNSPPNYFKWTQGKHLQTTAKAVLNVGAHIG